jgi:hypothetical protein
MTDDVARSRLLRGADEPAPPMRTLRAGPVTALLDGCDLRYVRIGRTEIARRIYAAVRDPSWNTISGAISDLTVEARDDSFDVRFHVRHEGDEIDFSWNGSIVGDPSGRITYGLDGRFDRATRYGRIGICVHHPWLETAGRPFEAQTAGGQLEGVFPSLIGPQRFVEGTYRALFDPFDRLEVELEGGGTALFEFAGDLWETEDHRNWTDANFKTYSTPLSLGPPAPAAAGETLRQQVELTPVGVHEEPASTGPVRLTIGAPTGSRVPAVGIGADADAHRPDERELELLRALGPRHLRVRIRLDRDAWTSGLSVAQETAGALGASLEVALELRPEHEGELARLAAALTGGPPVERVLVTVAGARTPPSNEETSAPELVELARSALAESVPGAAFVGGTALNFTEINRTRPQSEGWDGICYSISPQIHAFADVDLFENLDAQAETIRSARAFAGEKPLSISPIMLGRRPREDGEEQPGVLPWSVDPRQPSLLGAAWTVGSLKYVSEAGAATATYYESTGWRGVGERSSGSPLPQRFHSVAGGAFPLLHPLADVAGWTGAEVLAVESSDPLACVALGVRAGDGGTRLLVANLTGRNETAVIAPLEGGLALRRLNETATRAISDPIGFRASAERRDASHELELALGPYEVVRIDPS